MTGASGMGYLSAVWGYTGTDPQRRQACHQGCRDGGLNPYSNHPHSGGPYFSPKPGLWLPSFFCLGFFWWVIRGMGTNVAEKQMAGEAKSSSWCLDSWRWGRCLVRVLD